MAGQDPHAIQREIEHTRAELADTIDAIADRVSPKRVASRGAAKVRATVNSVLHGEDSSMPAPRHGVPLSELREIAGESSGAAFTGAQTYTIERQLRTDRVLMAVGAAAAVTALVIYVSYGRNRVEPVYVRR